jgi:hypothetical protein
LPPACDRLEGWIVEGVVGQVDGRAGRSDLVDAVQHSLVEEDVGHGELALKLLRGPRPDDRRGNGEGVEDEGARELDEGAPRLLGERGSCSISDASGISGVVCR